MKRIILVLLLIFSLTGCSRPKGFTIKKITSLHEAAPEWEVENSLSRGELDAMMNQPYTYLGSGNHTYAFGSEDGHYVIKFFKQKHMKTHTWVDVLPIPAKRIFYPMGKIDRRIKEREESFTSYKIAFEELPEETGILYLHLNKTKHLKIPLTLIDQNGESFTLDLDSMEFLVQKRADLAFQYLQKLYKEGQVEEAEQAIVSLLDVVAKRSQKGIYDKDLQLFKNFGFSRGQAMEIDIGEYRRDIAPHPTYEELQTLSLQIRDFVKMYAPKHLKSAEQEMKSYITEYK